MNNVFSLEGKTVLVTGASSGIGRETAIVCSKMGARVIVTGRNMERLQITLDSLTGEGHMIIAADLCKEEDIDRLATECPVLHGLVYNAGVAMSKLASFLKKEEMMDVFNVNFFGVALLTKALLKKKKIARGASLVFTASLSAHLTAAGLAMYASSKAGVCAYMRTCAIELAGKGIRANAVLPGMVETKLIDRGTYTEESKAKDLELYPLGRYGRPEDIAYGIVYLLSDASQWTTGTELVIDGGRSLK